MTEWFASYSGVEQMFLLAGIVGGIILVFRLILTVAGLDHHGGLDAVHVDSDGGFQALTIQGISSFFAMFGVVGFTLYHSAALGMVLALAGALAAGCRLRVDHPQDLPLHAASAVERHRQPVRRGRQRRLGLPHGGQGRRPRADQLRQSTARVRSGVSRRRDASPRERRFACKA